eukprot:Gregarina_sp_Poly_1__6288@NODE_333_length_9463_cov_335_720094_g281_i0_p7_GENE_NODE_333_length_9463_cov_335_720094_g281_i0NODE_333_length_9463_cov_335_720094_g281_i0_p7_ORF_typecomplete_len204_score41_01BTV_NS2/PF04514_12/0_062DDE_3/PF13358_6/0_17_NODE_333_length_9463_cov_335_720094_g281_i032223833
MRLEDENFNNDCKSSKGIEIKECQESQALVVTHTRKRRLLKQQTSRLNIAPLYTERGEITLWGVICRNQDERKRRERRRADAENRRQELQEKQAEQERRSAILRETDGNEFLACIFSGTDMPVQAKPEETKIPATEALSTDHSDIFDNHTESQSLDVFFDGAAHDEYGGILAEGVEEVEGNRVGRVGFAEPKFDFHFVAVDAI